MKGKAYWPKNLEQWTLAYFILPWPIFFFGYFQWPWAVQLTLLWGFLFKRAWDFYATYQSNFSLPHLSRWTWKIIIFCLLVWVLLSGADGFLFHQNGDYEKHNAMLTSLVSYPWPVAYRWPEGIDAPSDLKDTMYLTYYFAIYLPAALMGKFFGLVVARIVFALEVFAGVLLAWIWFLRFLGKFKWWILLIFIFASGMDLVGHWIMHSLNLMDGVGHHEWWAQYVFWSYQSQTTQLFWVPQHGITGWILASVFLDFAWPRKDGAVLKGWPCTWLLLTLIWSPFAVLGSVPLVALIFLMRLYPQAFQDKGFWRHPCFKNIIWSDVFASLIALIPILIFFGGDVSVKPNQPFWKVHNPYEYWPKYVVFCFVEFGAFTYFMLPMIKERLEKNYYRLMILIIVMLMLFPWYYFGAYNDFSMRSSIPWLFLLWLMVAKTLLIQPEPVFFWPRRHLVLLLLIGAMTPLCEISRAVRDRGAKMPYLNITQIRAMVAEQYFSYSRSLFGRMFAKKLDPQVDLPGVMATDLKNNYRQLRWTD